MTLIQYQDKRCNLELAVLTSKRVQLRFLYITRTLSGVANLTTTIK